MTIYRLEPHHVLEYRELMLQAYEQSPDAFTSTIEERSIVPLSWWLARLETLSETWATFGWFEDNMIVGAITLERLDKARTRHIIKLVGLYVHPAHRSQGVARSLIRTAVEHAYSLNEVTVIQLDVTNGNRSAQLLYESEGFEVYGLECMALKTERGYMDKVLMWRLSPRLVGAIRRTDLHI